MATNYIRQDISSHIKGNTFRGIRYTLDDGTNPIDLSSTDIRIQFRKNKRNGNLVATFTESDHITVVGDGTTGIFQIDDDFVIDWEAGLYFYDVLLNITGTGYRTWIWGEFTIIQNVTEAS